MSWPTTIYNGVDYWMYDGLVLVPVDPTTGAAILLLKPNGGSIISGVPAIADGQDGASPIFQEGPIDFDELAHGDPTPGGISVVQISPGPPPVYALTGALHSGADGAPGTTTISLAGVGGTAAAGKIIKVNAGATGFDFDYMRIAERYIPSVISNTGSGNPDSTLATVPITNKSWDYRILVTGHTIVTESGGSDVVVDLMARLNDEDSGNVVAECHGIGGTERLVFSSAPPAGAAASFDRVMAGSGTVNVYIRTEQRSGSNSYTTTNSTSRFAVWAIPIG
jgi:hypothetical protein